MIICVYICIYIYIFIYLFIYLFIFTPAISGCCGDGRDGLCHWVSLHDIIHEIFEATTFG